MELSWDKDNTRLLITVAHDSEVTGFVAIDSMVGGRSRGGLRMLPDINEAEISGLARTMTLKYGFLGLPQGGGKAGVLGDPAAPLIERRERLKAFGVAIAPLLRSYAFVPDTDMGTNNTDIEFLLRSAGAPVKPRDLRSANSGYYTALTVLVGVKRAAKHLGLTLSKCTVAIEGFGSVGSALAQLLEAVQARVVAISTSRGAIYNPGGLSVKRLVQLAAKDRSRIIDACPDAKRINGPAMLELPVDILCPCARHETLTMRNAPSVKARIICPGANNPMTPQAERLLFERGVMCMPDFMTNCGGVLGGTMEFASVSRKRIELFTERHLGARVEWLLNEAAGTGMLPSEIAKSLALRRFEQVQCSAAHPTPPYRLFNMALELYRRGVVPGRLVAILSLPYFRRCMAPYSR